MAKYLVILTFFLALTSNAQIELPAHSSSDEIVKHLNYTLQYNERYEQADWVAYKLTKDMLITNTPAKRKNSFKSDPLVPTRSADTQDYSSSGFDRGHLCPSADFKANQNLMDETFYMSNMAPMKHEFNAGIWENLENHERQWAIDNDELLIVDGPVLKDNPSEFIGRKNRVGVPKRFYKIIFDDKEPELKMIAFVIPHDAPDGDISIYAMTVRDAEQITGFDFFPTLSKDLQDKLETEMDLKKWGLNNSVKRYNQQESTASKPLQTGQTKKSSNPSMENQKFIIYVAVGLGIVVVVLLVVLVVGIRANKGK